MNCYIGIDIGTSATKTVLFDCKMEPIESATYEYPLSVPNPGYAEQSPNDWWDAVVKGIKSVLEQSGTESRNIKGIGLSGQMHGLVILDGNGRVIRPSIIWCDQRTEKECAELTELVGAKRLMEITMSPAVTGFTASKILWVKNNEPKNYSRIKHILLPKDYIRYMLTGEFASDLSDASGMQLIDISKRCWSNEIISAIGLDPDVLPKLYESPDITGRIVKSAAEATGLEPGTPVVAGAGDNAASAIGCGVVCPGKAFTTIGTSGVVFAHTEKPVCDKLGRIHTFCSAVPGKWHVMGVTQAAGLSLKWFKDNFCEVDSLRAEGLSCNVYTLLDSKAAEVPIGSNRLIFLPYLMGERTPHLDPNCRGCFIGLTASHSKYDMLRAVMEGVAFSLFDCLEIFRELGISTDTMLACGGGGSSPLWRQMLADLFGCSVKTAVSNQGGAMGAAILAAVGTGEYSSVEDACRQTVALKRTQEPIKTNTSKYREIYSVYRDLYPSLKENFKKLSKI